ncbi:MAG TPA: DUF1475 family protein [Gammaproteobacteria bacterium]|jgi:hypothetical protein|nr:DUF1475 family protein [Gammaproteobacteria bacterium]
MEKIDETSSSSQPRVAWQSFLATTLESLLAFYIATFCVAVYFKHRSAHWITPFIFLCLLYAFVIIACTKRVFKKLSIATVMLIIPIAPLIALIIVITMIPILQFF